MAHTLKALSILIKHMQSLNSTYLLVIGDAGLGKIFYRLLYEKNLRVQLSQNSQSVK